MALLLDEAEAAPDELAGMATPPTADAAVGCGIALLAKADGGVVLLLDEAEATPDEVAGVEMPSAPVGCGTCTVESSNTGCDEATVAVGGEIDTNVAGGDEYTDGGGGESAKEAAIASDVLDVAAGGGGDGGGGKDIADVAGVAVAETAARVVDGDVIVSAGRAGASLVVAIVAVVMVVAVGAAVAVAAAVATVAVLVVVAVGAVVAVTGIAAVEMVAAVMASMCSPDLDAAARALAP